MSAGSSGAPARTHRGKPRSGSGSRRRAAWVAAAAVTTGTVAVSGVAMASGPGSSGGQPSHTGENSAVLPQALSGAQTQSAAFAAAAGKTAGGGVATSGLKASAALTPPGAGATRLVMSPQRTKITPNAADPVVLRLYDLRTRTGVSGRNVRIMRADGYRWKTTAVLRTDAHGYARVTARLLSTTRIVAIFDGVDSQLLPSASSEATMTVVDPPPPPRAVIEADEGSSGSTAIVSAPASSLGARAVSLAAAQAGKPYVWGGNGPDSFDCSGLTRYVYAELGVSLPRTADEQYWATTHVSQAAMEPGDLIFYGPPGSIYHVAIYAGNGMMWEAPQTGEVVHLTPVRGTTYHVGRVF